MRFAWMVLALGLALAPPPATAAIYLDPGDWRAAVGGANSTLGTLPAQSLSITDYYGTYTSATRNDPVQVNRGSPSGPPDSLGSRGYLTPPPGPVDSAGQLSGQFGCFTPVYNCLGAYRIDYTLPFVITGIAGNLSLFSQPGGAADFPAFGFSRFAVDPTTGNPFRYTGFWGEIFDAPRSVISIVWTPGISSYDGGASFLLSNAVFITAAPGNSQVSVPEPVSMALFGAGLLGLGVVRRRHWR